MKKLRKAALTLGMSVLFGAGIAGVLRVSLAEPLGSEHLMRLVDKIGNERFARKAGSLGSKHSTPLIDRLENVSYDLRYRFKYPKGDGRRRHPDYGIHIIDIDEYSMGKMGSYWNWDRGHQAKMLDSLSKRFPAAIAYDVVFYDHEDKNLQERFSRAIAEAASGDSSLREYAVELDGKLPSLINYDKKFEEAIARSGRVTMGFAFMHVSDYANKMSEEVERRVTMDWHGELSPASALYLPDSLLGRITKEAEILDGIYPENARAARVIGHVNVIYNDEVIRAVEPLCRFGPHKPLYLPISIRTATTLFGTPNDEIVFKPDKYIDIGKPFKIFKDESGRLSFSYPDFTEAQLRKILRHRDTILSLKEGGKIDISAYTALYRDGNGDICVETRSARMTRELTAALFSAELRLDGMAAGDEAILSGGFTVLRDTDTEWEIYSEDGASFWLTDLDVKTLGSITADDIYLDEGENRKLLFFDFYVRRENGILITPVPVLRANTLDELLAGAEGLAESIAFGGRRDFGKNARIPLRKGNKHIVTYFGNPKQPFPYFSFYDIMENRADFPMEGRVFVVGSSSPALFDIFPAPHEKSFPGVETHASILNSIFTDTYVQRPKEWQDFAITAAVGVLVALVAFAAKPVWAGLFALAALSAYIFAALEIFSKMFIWIEMVRPALTAILAFSAVMAYRYMTEEKDRKYLQSTFMQYLSPELIEIMYAEKLRPKLGGDKNVCTAYFTDIEGFSTFSEKLGDPAKLVDLLNEYLSAMTEILSARRGTLDKYIGDAIVAFFGAPMPLKGHAAQACNTALDMQQKLAELRAKWMYEKCDRRCAERKCGDRCGEKEKWPQIVHNMRMRIGINTGEIITGNMGSAMRMNYTMMGDAVNLAARLESAAKQFGVYTLISEYTREMTGNSFETRLVDVVTVVGKTKPVAIYELLARKGGADAETAGMLEHYNRGVERYYAKDFEAAKACFEKSAGLEPNKTGKTNPSKRFIEKCEAYIANPPGEDWDGVEKLMSK